LTPPRRRACKIDSAAAAAVRRGAARLAGPGPAILQSRCPF